MARPKAKCRECGGPLEGWAGEHHSPQCSEGKPKLIRVSTAEVRAVVRSSPLRRRAV